MHIKNRWTIALIMLSEIVFILVVIAHWETLKYVPKLLSGFLSNQESFFDTRLVLKQACFYLLGLTLVLLTLHELIKNKKMNPWKWIGYGVYFITFLALELPLYHKHAGFAGTELHGHSFWDGLHFH